MSSHVSKFNILLIEPDKPHATSLKKLLVEELFSSTCLSEWVATLNYIKDPQTHTPDVIIINSYISGVSSMGINIEQVVSAVLHREDWHGVPTMLVRRRTDKVMDKFNQDENITKKLLSPFEQEDFLAATYTLLRKSLDGHIDEVNKQHIALGKMLQELLNLVKNRAEFSVIKNNLEKILDVIREHFKFEEDYMQPHDYPGFEEHKDNHQVLLNMIKGVITDLKKIQLPKLTTILVKLRADIYGDINDDKSYIDFLENSQKEIDQAIKYHISQSSQSE